MTKSTTTPLIQKLGIKKGFRIYIKGSPYQYNALLNDTPKEVTIVKKLIPDLHMIHAFINE